MRGSWGCVGGRAGYVGRCVSLALEFWSGLTKNRSPYFVETCTEHNTSHLSILRPPPPSQELEDTHPPPVDTVAIPHALETQVTSNPHRDVLSLRHSLLHHCPLQHVMHHRARPWIRVDLAILSKSECRTQTGKKGRKGEEKGRGYWLGWTMQLLYVFFFSLFEDCLL